jgi:hypothetical protein
MPATQFVTFQCAGRHVTACLMMERPENGQSSHFSLDGISPFDERHAGTAVIHARFVADLR